jgi:hypothetical protein
MIDFDKETFDELQDIKSNNGRQAYTDKKNCKIAFCLRGFKSSIEYDGTLKLAKVLEGVDVWCDDGAALYMTKDGKSHLVIEADFADTYDEFIEIVNTDDIDSRIKELEGIDMFITTRENVYDIDDLDVDDTSGDDVPVPVIGTFKPKRKFLNFVSAISGARVRLLRTTAFLKGEKISGVLEGVKFKVTICDEGTINFEEIDTNQSDKAMIQRLINDIDSMDVTGYAQKFIVANLEFRDADDQLCYLEVEHQKPIDRFASILDSLKEEETKVGEVSTTISDKGLSFLDSLFGDQSEDDVVIDEKTEEFESKEEVEVETKSESISYMEESFRKMNEEKVNELKRRIEDSQKDIIKYKNDMTFAERKLNEVNTNLGVLQTRLETMTPGDDPNGYVFFISEEQKSELGIDDNTKEIAGKIADLMNLKKDVLFKHLTEGFYNIRIAKKDDFNSEELEKEIVSKLLSIDPMGKISKSETGFEYRGELNWHQIVQKMIRAGFEQESEFDKFCNSNSYESKWSETEESDGALIGLENQIDTETVSNSTFYAEDLKTFTEPTDLVFIGTVDQYDSDGADIMITDDYSQFEVFVDGVKHKRKWGGFESDGFVTIMNMTQYQKWYAQAKSDIGDMKDSGVEGFFITGFKGTIQVGAKLEDGSYVKNINFNDYIQHQFEDCYDVFINLPSGTEVHELNGDLTLPVSVIRDNKIDKIIN